ncbi:hypothetical protein [[Actinomadura] parvosata]|uniref:hypothetical protein n=1 Tax=[Actinomadura] parvosata TaxID=1955412 RepID=UPI0012BB585B|nr:hypothetical protein [Nonomuraea sp. ATCC 55076]
MLDVLASIGDTISGVGAILAVLAALYVSNKTRQDVQRDRDIQILPVLAFQPGGIPLPLHERNFGHRIGGMNPTYVESAFQRIPADAKILDLGKKKGDNNVTQGDYGELFNYGHGPAFDVRVTWQAEVLEISTDSFPITKEQRSSPRFAEGSNRLPSVSRHIPPGAKGQLTRLPTFYILDLQRVIDSIECRVVIRYKDMLGRPLETVQNARISSFRSADEPYCIVTFSDVIGLPEPLNSGRRPSASAERISWINRLLSKRQTSTE